VEYKIILFTAKAIDTVFGGFISKYFIKFIILRNCGKKNPCQKINFSIKGNVANGISFPSKKTKKVALYTNFVSKFW
jgi:hypothetical protein